MQRFRNLIINPFIIAFVITIVIIAFLPPMFNKYKIEIIEHSKHPNAQIYYHDLNNNGFDEWIYFFYNQNNNSFPSVECRKLTGLNDATSLQVNQVNLKKNWLAEPCPVFYDFDSDGNDEIFFLAHQRDSLFLLGVKPWQSINNPFIEKYICDIPVQNGEPDTDISKLFLHDLNGDHYKEIVFTVMGGWNAEPRILVSYNIFNDSITIKDHRYAALHLSSIVDDKKTGAMILCSSYAPGNMKNPPSPYFSDNFAWFFIFDKNLNPLFPPVKENRYKSNIISIARAEDDNTYFYAAFNTLNINDSAFIRKYDTQGNLVAKAGLDGRHSIIDKSDMHGELFVHAAKTNTAYELNPDLSFGKPCMSLANDVVTLDLQNDGVNEFVFYDYNQYDFVIIPDDFSSPVRIQLPGMINNWRVTDMRLTGSKANLFIQKGEDVYFCHYLKNQLYYFKYPVYLFIYLIVTFFLYFLLKEQKRKIELKYEQEKRLNRLEILTIKNQIDPHFTFNAINTISAFVMRGEKQKTHDFLANFSKLIRNALLNSREISVVLKDELEFVNDYLKLQQMRFDNAFEFNISIAKDVDINYGVPRMIIQTFTENAVKHGLRHKKEKGMLDIILTKQNKKLNIKIIDNGVGREQAKNLSKHSTGKGHEIIKQIIEMYNKLKNTNVEYRISDVRDETGDVGGTKVEIVI